MLYGRVFNYTIATRFGLSSLIALVDAKIWMNLFDTIGIAYVSETRDFYNDVMFIEKDLSLDTTINGQVYSNDLTISRDSWCAYYWIRHYEGQL